MVAGFKDVFQDRGLESDDSWVDMKEPWRGLEVSTQEYQYNYNIVENGYLFQQTVHYRHEKTRTRDKPEWVETVVGFGRPL